MSELVSPSQSLADAIAWCTPRVRAEDLRGCLRSPELAPWWLGARIDRASLVRETIERRARLLRGGARLGSVGPYRAASPAPGRLLAYFPDELFDGAAELESGGFFDEGNAPPWDSWVALIDLSPREARGNGGPRAWFGGPTLLAWVPAALVPVAQRGIDVNPEECVTWADTIGVTLR